MAELADECVKPMLGTLKPRELCALELGLSFLADHLPEQGTGALWPILSSYMQLGPELKPQIRTLRELMGPLSRSGTLREKLDLYVKLPAQVRGFDPGEMRGHKADPTTVFTRRPSPYAAARHDTYRQALQQTAPYKARQVRGPVPSGTTCTFPLADGSREQVRIPDTFVPAQPPPTLAAVTSRTREPIPVTEADLQRAAEEMDELLADHPEVSNRNFVKRLRDMDAALANQLTGRLNSRLEEMSIDGLWHVVGLMNSGKSTLLDLLAFIIARRGGKVGFVLASGGDVYAKISFLRVLGIDAVPIFGRTRTGLQADRYWRSILHDGDTTFPAGADPAAEFADDQCYLEDLRQSNSPNRQPLLREERPCTGKLSIAGRSGRGDCPILAQCPAHASARNVAQAQVWVTTAAGLASTLMPQSQVEVRVAEAAQHHLDALLVDEADTVQQQFDDQFLLNEILSLPGRGWSHRVGERLGQKLEHSWFLDLLDPDINATDKHFRRHDQAMTELYQLMIDPVADDLRALISEGPFTGYSLLRRLARNLHGLGERNDFTHKADLEEAADVYFDEHFKPLVSAPFQAPPEDWAELVQAMTATHDTAASAQEAAEAWIQAHQPSLDADTTPRRSLDALAQVLQAGLWAARITTSFFEVAQRLPAITSTPIGNGEDFWSHQPPRDLLAFIPEQAAGNLMALQWRPNPGGDSGSFSILWLRGVGRWLLYHLHDLLTPEGIDGPNVLLASATSWMPASPRYHLDVPPNLVLREPPTARAALQESRMLYRPRRYPDGRPVFVSGTGGDPVRHAQALRAVADGICNPMPGAAWSLLEQARQHLAADRQQVLFTVQSTRDAEIVADYINHKTRYTALHVIRDDDPPTSHSLPRRRLATFATSGADILVAAEGAIQRGHNILNTRGVAALGAVFYLARIHPPTDDATFPLSLLSQEAMRRLHRPVDLTLPGHTDPTDLARVLRQSERRRWQRRVGEPVLFSRLTDPTEHAAFVGNFLVPLYQTLGRGIRGNEKVDVYLCDAAFAPRAADLDDPAPDTARTSVIVAAQQLLHGWLATPGPTATTAERLNHELAQACWGLASHLLDSIDWGHR
ncbi:pPIWI_RE_Z domain-containing protein [Kitasatospora sp. NPDC004240]